MRRSSYDVDPSRTDRRTRQLGMTEEQKQADAAVTTAFTVGLAASRLNHLLRGDLKMLEKEEKNENADDENGSEKFVIASTEDEEAKVRMDGNREYVESCSDLEIQTCRDEREEEYPKRGGRDEIPQVRSHPRI